MPCLRLTSSAENNWTQRFLKSARALSILVRLGCGVTVCLTACGAKPNTWALKRTGLLLNMRGSDENYCHGRVGGCGTPPSAFRPESSSPLRLSGPVLNSARLCTNWQWSCSKLVWDHNWNNKGELMLRHSNAIKCNNLWLQYTCHCTNGYNRVMLWRRLDKWNMSEWFEVSSCLRKRKAQGEIFHRFT